MNLALGHPEFGYYRTRNPFGAGGDFITAPEVSQVFGELLGLWLAAAWQQAGNPTRFRLVELGPGRGQLMADLLRATAGIAGFLEAAELHLVESSERLRAIQRQALPATDVHWHDDLETVPDGPLFLIGNEFLDALPVHQLVRTERGWAERLISGQDDGSLGFTEGPASPDLIDLIIGGDKAGIGDIAEVSPDRLALVRMIAARLKRDGGVALLIDYGAAVSRPTGDTLQAVRDHQPAAPLEEPGLADVTTQVDFLSLARTARAAEAAVHGPMMQGAFLRALGIELRTAMLLKGADEKQSHRLRSALFRLTDASAMGELFKALALTPPDGPTPPAFG